MGRISLTNEDEEEHALGVLVSSAVCWEVRPKNVGYARTQRFHVDLKPGEYNANLCIGKYGEVAIATFSETSDGFALKDYKVVQYREVFAIDKKGHTAPDYDFYSGPDLCAVLGVGKFALTLRSVKFKSGKGQAYNKKDSDRPEFGCGNSDASTCGDPAAYVPLSDLAVSDPLGGSSGEYGFQYWPFHCASTIVKAAPDGLKRGVMLMVLLAEIRRNVGTLAWDGLNKLIDPTSEWRTPLVVGQNLPVGGLQVAGLGHSYGGLAPVNHDYSFWGGRVRSGAVMPGALSRELHAVGDGGGMSGVMGSILESGSQVRPGPLSAEPSSGGVEGPETATRGGGGPAGNCGCQSGERK